MKTGEGMCEGERAKETKRIAELTRHKGQKALVLLPYYVLGWHLDVFEVDPGTICAVKSVICAF